MMQRKYQSIAELKAKQKRLKAQCKKMENEAIETISSPQNLILGFVTGKQLGTKRKKNNQNRNATNLVDTNGIAFGIITELLSLLPINRILTGAGKTAARTFIKVQTVNLAMRLIKGMFNKIKSNKKPPNQQSWK